MARKKQKRIIIVDDEKDMRGFLEIMLRKSGYEPLTFASGDRAVEYMKNNPFDLVISDIRMPGMDGLELLKEVKASDPDAPVIMMTAYASIETAIEATRAGAFSYLTKPFKIEQMKVNIKKALEHGQLKRENRILKEDLRSRWGISSMVGKSARMKEIFELIKSIAPTKANVLITGESGTGKELVARAIHCEAHGHTAPFVAVNCGAIPENLLESEFFGSVKGAYTGAVSDREGLVEQADGGTLFLDEITEMPLHLQVKLLRFIQERSFRRVGGSEDIQVDLRIIAASNRDVEEEVREGRFREDLFYRLNVIRIVVPPLRLRKEDIPVMAEHFLDRFSRLHGKDVKGISPEAMDLLKNYDFPGNIRELENLIERAVTLEKTRTLRLESLPPFITGNGAAASAEPVVPDEGLDLEKTVEEFEKAIIADALRKSGGVKKRAAELLGLSFRSIRYKLSKYDLQDK